MTTWQDNFVDRLVAMADDDTIQDSYLGAFVREQIAEARKADHADAVDTPIEVFNLREEHPEWYTEDEEVETHPWTVSADLRVAMKCDDNHEATRLIQDWLRVNDFEIQNRIDWDPEFANGVDRIDAVVLVESIRVMIGRIQQPSEI